MSIWYYLYICTICVKYMHTEFMHKIFYKVLNTTFSLALVRKRGSSNLSLLSCFPMSVKHKIYFPRLSNSNHILGKWLFSPLIYCGWNTSFPILSRNEYTLPIIAMMINGQKLDGKGGYHFTHICISQLWRSIYALF